MDLMKGKAEGIIEATKQMVLNLAKEGVSIETIIMSTGLTTQQLSNVVLCC
jgi:hypothetical protein